MGMALNRLLYLLWPLMALCVVACATSSDLRTLRSEVNREMDEKLATVDTRVAAVKSEQEKSMAALASMRKGQANTSADFAELRESIQELRGQIETLRKEVSRDVQKEDDYTTRLDHLAMKINFIENFLEIGRKDVSADASEDLSATTKDPGGKPDKAAMYAAAYAAFKAGNYTSARESFQAFLKTFPSGEYSDNAQFWIGECYFFEKKYEKAILEYEKVTKNFPSSNKVPYALLKQGLSFQNLGDKTSARLLLQQVIKDYPNTSQARIARSKLQEIK